VRQRSFIVGARPLNEKDSHDSLAALGYFKVPESGIETRWTPPQSTPKWTLSKFGSLIILGDKGEKVKKVVGLYQHTLLHTFSYTFRRKRPLGRP
jgi:hypothetical protein